jgi:hypothetical protein
MSVVTSKIETSQYSPFEIYTDTDIVQWKVNRTFGQKWFALGLFLIYSITCAN